MNDCFFIVRFWVNFYCKYLIFVGEVLEWFKFDKFFFSYFFLEDICCKIYIYNYVCKGVESEEDVKWKVLMVCCCEYVRKREFSFFYGNEEVDEELSDGCFFWGELVIYFEKVVCKFCGCY